MCGSIEYLQGFAMKACSAKSVYPWEKNQYQEKRKNENKVTSKDDELRSGVLHIMQKEIYHSGDTNDFDDT